MELTREIELHSFCAAAAQQVPTGKNMESSFPATDSLYTQANGEYQTATGGRMSTDDRPLTLIDLSIARENIPGGSAGIQHMARILDSECERLIGELRDAQADGDATKFQRAAHTLKSASGVFGALPVAELSRELEAIGKSGDLTDVEDRVTKLESLVATLRSELDSIIHDAPAG